MTKDIKDLLDNDPKNVIKAVLSLYPMDKNIRDAEVINSIAEFYHKNKLLTHKQIILVRSILKRKSDMIMPDFYKQEVVIKEMPTSKTVERKVEQEDDYTAILKFSYDRELIEKVKKITGRKFLPDKKAWTIPLTKENLEHVKELGFQTSKKIEDWRKEETIQTAISEIELQLPKNLEQVLHPFQKQGVAFVESKGGRALIADDMGLGKSCQSITWVELHKNDPIYPVLIVCPAAVKLNWQREFKKFVGRTDIEILGSRTPYMPQEDKILIINYDILEAWEPFIMQHIKPVTIIADEIHKCKGDSKRQKALTKISKKVKHFIGLTGTPIMNRPVEILYPVRMIQPNLFPSVKAFKYRYCGPKFNGFAMEFKGATNTVELNSILTNSCMIRRKKEDVLTELPDKTLTMIPIEITNRKSYSEAVEDLVAFLKKIDLEKALKAQRAEALVKMNVLKQLAVEGKISQSLEWISDFVENEDAKLIVFAHYKSTVEKIMEKFKNNAVKYVGGMTDNQRAQAEKMFWEDKKTQIFVGNIEAAGTGINLQVSSNVAFIEYPWSPGLYAQAMDRSHRMGQKNAVNIWNLVAQDTIEEAIIKTLEAKSKIIAQVVDGDASDGNGMFNELIKGFYQHGEIA